MARPSEFKSEDPGFDPLAGQGKLQFLYSSESTLVQIGLCLSLLRVYYVTHPNGAHVKDPVSICRKRVGITAGGMETRKHCTHKVGGGGGGGDAGELGSAALWLLVFTPGKASRIVCAKHWDEKVIQSNLMCVPPQVTLTSPWTTKGLSAQGILLFLC